MPTAAIDEISRTRVYRNGALEMENCPISQVSDYLQEPDTVVWVDLCAPSPADVRLVGDELGLHHLAVEDAIEAHQRPKLDRYDDHQFLSMYAVGLDPASGELRLNELAVFITSTALVTVRKDDSFDIPDVNDRWDENADLARHGVGFLLYGLVDLVVDGHFDAVQVLDDEIEQLEDLLFDDGSRNADVQRRSFSLRKSLVVLRRVVLPMREVVNTLMRRDLDVVAEPMRPYFEDVYDHVVRATEWTESLRDLVTTILETNLTIQGNRLNVITKQVTSWAAIIAVPTAITGFYGQNLPYPGFAARSGFIWSCLLIVLLSGTLYLTFRRKGWL
ncbi:MAG: magnesium transporter CorA family protein [Propionibacteriales bacterium]|nr:magnesium transporter CorA family protein [Propionibacteriales bacterium]